MTETTTPLVVQNYLAQLDAALVGVADATARDIRAGIAEELIGLDASLAAVRIEQLGDPFFIAAEAREASREPDGELDPAERLTAQFVAPHPSDAPIRVDSSASIVLASLLVALGGLVVPLLGWIAGIVMVWTSQVWTRREKWLATLAPLGAMIIVTGVAIAVFMAGMGATSAPRRYAENSSSDPISPLIPTWYDIAWSSMLVLILVNFVVGLTLLVRAQRRRRDELLQTGGLK